MKIYEPNILERGMPGNHEQQGAIASSISFDIFTIKGKGFWTAFFDHTFCH
jgi:hypothetical protein